MISKKKFGTTVTAFGVAAGMLLGSAAPAHAEETAKTVQETQKDQADAPATQSETECRLRWQEAVQSEAAQSAVSDPHWRTGHHPVPSDNSSFVSSIFIPSPLMSFYACVLHLCCFYLTCIFT